MALSHPRAIYITNTLEGGLCREEEKLVNGVNFAFPIEFLMHW